MGGGEGRAPALLEPAVGYHPYVTEVLTWVSGARLGTVSGGQFDWGGRLPKSNGGAQRYPQRGWKSRGECKGIRVLDSETDGSSWVETRA